MAAENRIRIYRLDAFDGTRELLATVPADSLAFALETYSAAIGTDIDGNPTATLVCETYEGNAVWGY